MIQKESNAGQQQPNTIDKISSEEDNDQKKNTTKVITSNDQTTVTHTKQESLNTLLNRTEQFLQSNTQKQNFTGNNTDAQTDEMAQPISTRDQRIQRVRSRVAKLENSSCSAKEIDANYKIVLIGDSGVGKTSMLLRFADDIFNQNPLSTIGVDFKIKTLKVDKKIIKMQVWDTAGQERFQSMSQAYYRNANGCLAVFDVTNRDSFESMKLQVQNYIQYKYSSMQNKHPQYQLNQKSSHSKKKPNAKEAQQDAAIATQYLNTEGAPVIKGIRRADTNKDKVANIGIKSQKVTDPWNLPMLKNIVIVGTKQDLVITPRSAGKRKVEFSEVVEFCRQNELSGCLEVSSRIDIQQFQQYQKLGRKPPNKGQFADLNDAFFMLACNCVDYTTRQLLIESAESPVELPQGKQGLSMTSLAINPQQRGNNQLNKTVNYGTIDNHAWCAQSEEGLVQRARLANDSSFYSFRLQPVGLRKRKAGMDDHENTEYDGMIYRKSFPRERHYDMTTSESSFNRNNCC